MMRHKVSTTGSFLLILAIVVVGLGGCSRSAEERESPTTVATSTSGGVPTVGTIGPGETVVSAVTSLPQTPVGTVEQATLVPVNVTPGTAQPLPTSQPASTVAPAAPTASSGSGGVIWHTVQPGETLSSIARRYGTTWQAIAEANGLVNPSQIYVGQKLKIPTAGGTSGGTSGGTTGCRIQHTVQRGEWVWQIARNYGVSPYDILAANGMTIQSANTIYAGQVLCIP